MPKKSPNKAGYAEIYRNTDFRRHPERYRIGRGEQGALIAEPYKGEILPHWRFATPEKARASAEKSYEMFLDYKEQEDFVGMDMARKFLQMGFTRSRRYANHASGKKVRRRPSPRSGRALGGVAKAESARIFYRLYRSSDDLEDGRWNRLRAGDDCRDSEERERRGGGVHQGHGSNFGASDGRRATTPRPWWSR